MTSTRTGVVHFSISGPFVTQHARERVDEMGWANALRFLTESIHDLSVELAVDVLRGHRRFVGDTREDGIFMDDEEPHVREALAIAERNRWGSIYREGTRHWRPYGVVALQRDPGDMGRTWSEQMDDPEWEEFNRHRVHHYMRRRRDDRAVVCALPTERRFVLFQRCDPPPFWIQTCRDWQTAALTSLEAGNLGDVVLDARFESQAAADFMRWMSSGELPDLDMERRFGHDRVSMGMTEMLAEGAAALGVRPEAVRGLLGAVSGDVPEEPPDPVEPDEAESGYITRDGRIYPCEYHQHANLARLLFAVQGQEPDDPERAADDAGWIRLQRSAMTGAAYNCAATRRPSAAQRRTFEDWCLFHHVDPATLQVFDDKPP